MDINEEKRRIKERIWRLLEEKGVARFPKPIRGRIPNFKGSEVAAYRLVSHTIFRSANVIFCCPDSPQRPVREHALRTGKVLIMATPRLREGFLIITRDLVPRGRELEASTIKGAFKHGRKVDVPDLKVDLKVTGSVAVTERGARLGKGGGYSDLEYAILREVGVIDDSTPLATTVHDLQVIDHIPLTLHDVPVDYIFTPTRVITVDDPIKEKPKGIILEELSQSKIKEVPLLQRLLNTRKADTGILK